MYHQTIIGPLMVVQLLYRVPESGKVNQLVSIIISGSSSGISIQWLFLILSK